MELPIVTKQDLEDVKADIIKQVKECLNETFLKTKGEEYLTQEEACKILNVCTRQFRKYREDRRLTYTKIGNKIYVRRSDLDAFMQRYSFRQKDWR